MSGPHSIRFGSFLDPDFGRPRRAGCKGRKARIRKYPTEAPAQVSSRAKYSILESESGQGKSRFELEEKRRSRALPDKVGA